MFQQHYIYFMAHRYLHESMVVDAEAHVFDILTKFTKRYTNPNASEIVLLNKFYPEVDDERLQSMTLADAAVRLLLDSKAWQKPTDPQHFSKACMIARRPWPQSAVGSSSSGFLPLGN